jgi:hypothetical protein
MHQQSLGNDASPTLSLFVGSPDVSTAVLAYVNATAGALYRGVARATPITTLNTPAHALPATQRLDSSPDVRPTELPLGTRAGVFLFVTGGVISGYDWLRARRLPVPPAPTEEALLGVLEDELLEDDQEL